MFLVESNSAADAWIKTSKLILEKGTRLGDITECMNTITEKRCFGT